MKKIKKQLLMLALTVMALLCIATLGVTTHAADGPKYASDLAFEAEGVKIYTEGLTADAKGNWLVNLYVENTTYNQKELLIDDMTVNGYDYWIYADKTINSKGRARYQIEVTTGWLIENNISRITNIALIYRVRDRTTDSNWSVSSSLDVNLHYTPVTGVQFTKSNYTVYVDERADFTKWVKVTPAAATNKVYEIVSSDTDGVRVVNTWEGGYTGTIRPLKKGVVTLSAITKDGRVGATCTVNVIQRVTGVYCSGGSYMNSGEKRQLKVEVSPADANNKNVKWTTTNPYVATVDSKGNVTAHSAGTAKIYATAIDGSGMSDYVIITVNLNNRNWSDDRTWPVTNDGYTFTKDTNGAVRAYNSKGAPVINDFKCDGIYTYYFQLDGTAMMDRLTYHPDGEHVIYFDEWGHEVFSDFANVKKTIAGDVVDDYCFFNVFGYMYVDVLTYDKTGTELYYANPYGVLERDGWFQFSNTAMWADGTPANGVGGKYGYAWSDGTLRKNEYGYDWNYNSVYYQADGTMIYR